MAVKNSRNCNTTLYSGACTKLRTDATAFLMLLPFFRCSLSVERLLSVLFFVLFYLHSSLAMATLLYISRSFLSFFFVYPFSPPAHTDPPSAVYLRSADAHNGQTKVTEFASVQQTTRARVGLNGRELQTIVGLRDNVIVFFFSEDTNKWKEETCDDVVALLRRAQRAVVKKRLLSF